MKKLLLACVVAMSLFIVACGSEKESESSAEVEVSEEETESVETNEKETDTATVEDINPEFKAAMDEFELFFDDYCEFMGKYKDSTDVTSMLEDYNAYMLQYTETMEKLEAIDENELSEAELAYYTEVTARITEKLSEVEF